MYHCTNRCVRRAWLCGIDPDTQQNYEHRKTMVEGSNTGHPEAPERIGQNIGGQFLHSVSASDSPRHLSPGERAGHFGWLDSSDHQVDRFRVSATVEFPTAVVSVCWSIFETVAKDGETGVFVSADVAARDSISIAVDRTLLKACVTRFALTVVAD